LGLKASKCCVENLGVAQLVLRAPIGRLGAQLQLRMVGQAEWLYNMGGAAALRSKGCALVMLQRPTTSKIKNCDNLDCQVDSQAYHPYLPAVLAVGVLECQKRFALTDTTLIL
jgi:hypothetical protein